MIRTINIQYYKSPVGELIIGSLEDKLVMCDWRYRKTRKNINKRILESTRAKFVEEENTVITNCVQQLTDYFQGHRREFHLPLSFIGTDFQKEVWEELRLVPYGKTISYTQLAKMMNHPKAIRAIAAANGANAIAIIVPCHRIIGGQGELVGYAGGLTAKQKLLHLEGSFTQTKLFDY